MEQLISEMGRDRQRGRIQHMSADLLPFVIAFAQVALADILILIVWKLFR